jgi:hypothetical protein
MGMASFAVTFSLDDVTDGKELFKHLLDTIGEDVLSLKSVELQLPGQLPGRPSFFKHELSFDGAASFIDQPALELLPGEALVPNRNLTILQNSEGALTMPRDELTVFDQLDRVRSEAAALVSSGMSRRAWVVWRAWGLTRSAYLTTCGELEEGSFLRERLEHYRVYVPILHITANFAGNPSEGFTFELFSNSHQFSYFEPVFSEASREWILKSDARAAQRNAQILAESIEKFLRKFAGAAFQWDVSREHSPDLAGSIPAELLQRFGPPRATHRVPNTMSSHTTS